tara:strand:- start:846 stop:1112 length:267 start_codon:yes stop_codon:yes gene_type:complete
MNKTYTLYSDSSHGWLQVQRKELEELNIINNVSEYSYINGQFVYLEEDCDLNLFINAYKSKYNVKPIIKECLQENNGIRLYSRFKKAV